MLVYIMLVVVLLMLLGLSLVLLSVLVLLVVVFVDVLTSMVYMMLCVSAVLMMLLVLCVVVCIVVVVGIVFGIDVSGSGCRGVVGVGIASAYDVTVYVGVGGGCDDFGTGYNAVDCGVTTAAVVGVVTCGVRVHDDVSRNCIDAGVDECVYVRAFGV